MVFPTTRECFRWTTPKLSSITWTIFFLRYTIKTTENFAIIWASEALFHPPYATTRLLTGHTIPNREHIIGDCYAWSLFAFEAIKCIRHSEKKVHRMLNDNKQFCETKNANRYSSMAHGLLTAFRARFPANTITYPNSSICCPLECINSDGGTYIGKKS